MRAANSGTERRRLPSVLLSEDRIGLCDQTRVDLGLPFVPIERGRPAAIELTTARPLGQEGRAQIPGGAVLLWPKPGSDPMVLATRFSPS